MDEISPVYNWVFLICLFAFLLAVIILLCFTEIISANSSQFLPHHAERVVETASLLSSLTEDARLSYEQAKYFQLMHPPESVATDITLSQYVSIQEKGISAFEFEWEMETQSIVSARTEIQFSDGESCVQTNLPMPRNQEVYYWEAKMYDKPSSTMVAVGVATKPYPYWRLPGWNDHSLGYFSHTGNKHFNNPFKGKPYGDPYEQGDVIGVGYRHRTGTLFFTKNGKKLDEACFGLRYNLFPTIGANGPCQIHVNLGQRGFVYLEANVKKWGLAPVQGTQPPPPAYGHDIGSMLLESGVGETSYLLSGHQCTYQSTHIPPRYSTYYYSSEEDSEDDRPLSQLIPQHNRPPSPPPYSSYQDHL